jgi:hypothetical protein
VAKSVEPAAERRCRRAIRVLEEAAATGCQYKRVSRVIVLNEKPGNPHLEPVVRLAICVQEARLLELLAVPPEHKHQALVTRSEAGMVWRPPGAIVRVKAFGNWCAVSRLGRTATEVRYRIGNVNGLPACL